MDRQTAKPFDVGILFEPEITAWAPVAPGAEVLIRYLASDARRALAARFISHRIVDGEREEVVDDDGYVLALCEAAIVDWRGFAMNGEEFPFTPENRDRLAASKWDGFLNTVRNVSRSIEVMVAAREAAALKNSGPTPRPDSITPA